MKDYNSDQSVLATPDAESSNSHIPRREATGGPDSLAEHLKFPDAKRVFRVFAEDMDECGFRLNDGNLGCELCLPSNDESAVDAVKHFSFRMREFLDWLEAKVEGYEEFVRNAKKPSLLSYSTGSLEGTGDVADYCGSEFVYGDSFRKKNVWYITYKDFWDSFIEEDPGDNSSEGYYRPEKIEKALVDVFVHAAKQGYVAPE